MSLLLTSGIYTVGDASRLLQVSPRKIRRWISGYTKSAAVIENDLGWLGDSLAFSFANLMEMRFIQFFAHRGVSVHAIRAMAEEAQRLLDHPHPFATNTLFKTDGKKIFAEIAAGIDDSKLYDLKMKNFAMLPVIEASLLKDTAYNPRGDAIAWRPRVDTAPNVIILPNRSFGRPIIRGDEIPTRALNDAWESEGDHKVVAHWFEVSPERVLEAVEFEQRLAMAA